METTRSRTNWLPWLVTVVVAVILLTVLVPVVWLHNAFDDDCDGGGDAVTAALETDPMATVDIPGTSRERRRTQRACTDWKGTSRAPETSRQFLVDDATQLESIVDMATAAADRAGWEDIETEWRASRELAGSLQAHRLLLVESTQYEAELDVAWAESYGDAGRHWLTISVRAQRYYGERPSERVTTAEPLGVDGNGKVVFREPFQCPTGGDVSAAVGVEYEFKGQSPFTDRDGRAACSYLHLPTSDGPIVAVRLKPFFPSDESGGPEDLLAILRQGSVNAGMSVTDAPGMGVGAYLANTGDNGCTLEAYYGNHSIVEVAVNGQDLRRLDWCGVATAIGRVMRTQ